MVFEWFCFKNGYRFCPFWSDIGYVFHSGLPLDILHTRNYSFPQFVALLKCLPKRKLFLVSCDHILELCNNFEGLKWGIDFSFGSEKGMENNRVWPETGYRFQGSGRLPSTKTLGSTSRGYALLSKEYCN